MKKTAWFLPLIVILFMAGRAIAETTMICSSTTSTENSGLFGHIIPIFEKKTGIRVKVVARGTGAAIEMGKRGDADVAFVHAKEQELKAVEEGYFVNRHDVMYNDYVIIGPTDDPAKVKGNTSTVEAFKKISAASQLVSRGDNSGTHTKELSIWKKAGVEPKGQQWYIEVGQGMEKTQRIANEKRAYTLTDRGTWLSFSNRRDLGIVVEGDPPLFNQYGVILVNPARHPHVKESDARAFIGWLVSPEGQAAIAGFRVNGEQAFFPNADWAGGHDRD